MKVILLNSGGLDTLVSAAYAKSLGYELHSLFVDMGQVSVKRDRESAQRIAEKFGVTHKETVISGGPYRATNGGVPFTKMFFSFLASIEAVSQGIETVVTGAKKERNNAEMYIKLADLLSCANISQPPVFIKPVWELSLEAEVALGLKLGLTMEEMKATSSCFQTEEVCNQCVTCLKRQEVGL